MWMEGVLTVCAWSALQVDAMDVDTLPPTGDGLLWPEGTPLGPAFDEVMFDERWQPLLH